jgi:eukaryotic-like serine/threonine-protein kinase
VKKADASPSRVGEFLGEKYRITRYLGEGGMGTVYEAQHAIVGRRFAVKYLHQDLAGEEEILERFRREARTAGALENENIVSVVDFGIASDGIPYLVMEMLVGEDLAQLLRREGPLPVVRAVNLIIQACRGLDAAHAAGIVHRDLKPENLFICRRGDGTDLVKILDFGIAKLSQAGVLGPVTSVTRAGSTMGTPFYMPPEQARGAKEVDQRADIYSLGVILFEALSGDHPHPGDSYNQILYHILTQPPVPVERRRPGLPAGLVDTLRRAIAFDPKDRQGSAAELARALAPHAGRQVTPIRSQFDLRVTREAAPGRSPEEPAPLSSRKAAPTRIRRRALGLLTLALGLVAAGSVAWFLARQQARPSRAARAPDVVPSPPPAAPSPPRLAPEFAPDAQLADSSGTASPAPALARPAETKPTVSGSARKKGTKRAPSRPPGDVPVAPPAGASPPVFDERNPYE